jgi:hypothetical protein
LGQNAKRHGRRIIEIVTEQTARYVRTEANLDVAARAQQASRVTGKWMMVNRGTWPAAANAAITAECL